MMVLDGRIEKWYMGRLVDGRLVDWGVPMSKFTKSAIGRIACYYILHLF